MEQKEILIIAVVVLGAVLFFRSQAGETKSSDTITGDVNYFQYCKCMVESHETIVQKCAKHDCSVKCVVKTKMIWVPQAGLPEGGAWQFARPVDPYWNLPGETYKWMDVPRECQSRNIFSIY